MLPEERAQAAHRYEPKDCSPITTWTKRRSLLKHDTCYLNKYNTKWFQVSTCLVVHFLLHVMLLDGNRWLPLTTGHRSAPLKADDLAGYLSKCMEQLAQSQQYCVKNNSIVNSFAMIYYFRSVRRRWILNATGNVDTVRENGRRVLRCLYLISTDAVTRGT